MKPILFFFLFQLVVGTIQVQVSQDVSALLGLKNTIRDPSGRLSGWKESDASPCAWSGIECNAQGRVVALNLASRGLTGAGTISGPSVSHLSELVTLNISNNEFIGSLPASISTLTSLEILDIYNNNLTGPLPVELGSLPSIRELHLGGNYFSGSIPSQYGKLTTLRYLALSGNSLTGRIPQELSNLHNLEELYIGYYNRFEGGIPREFGRLSKLTVPI